MTFLDQIKERLDDQGITAVESCPCFIGYMPDKPDQAVVLIPSGGGPQETHAGETRHGSFQVKVRTESNAYVACIEKWEELFSTLQDCQDALTDVLLIQALASEPMVWYDEKNRVCASLNMRYVRKNQLT